ncbi:Uu.00g011150.m01.CDS01 [Anthostomella pinea]|uniref:Uu.00g011150.m01.CDS01 n=1 Tax=Anthostomella pinea TaxID=933095 RepID=A0AAI8YQ67_9PEZI|nr:Uu.00g011150.m01.CDS01 [Anthostomella pinea]
MSLLPVLAPPSSFQIGLRAIFRRSEKLLVTSTARQFSTKRNPISELCLHYSNHGSPRPSSTLRNCRSRNLLPQLQARTVFSFRATTHYTKLPESYEDALGLLFRREDLNQREVNELFGAHLSARQANELLKIIHGRRVAGTLEDPNLQQNTAQFSNEDKITALNYLRKHIPVDEVINAGLRAEDELRDLEAQTQDGKEAEERTEETVPQDAPPEPQDDAVEAPTGKLKKQPGTDSPYGVSNFDMIRAENIARQEAYEKRLEEERLAYEEEVAKGNIGTLQTHEQGPRELSPFVQRHMERATSKLEAPPEMKAWERLLPTFAMTVLICGACAVFAYTYKPPRRSDRIWPDIPPAAATCLALVGLNLSVWTLWKFPPLWAALNRYFIVIAATPRPLQVLGAVFSHQSFSHVAVNMVALWFFGTRVHDEIGRGNFLALYIASGVLGFTASLANLVLRRGLQYTTLGASGAVYGIIVAFFWSHKFDEFKILGYPPDPISAPQGLAFIGLILGAHLVGLFSKRATMVDIASHIGGMLGGVAGIELIRRRMDDKARLRAEKMKTMGVLDKIVDKEKTATATATQISPAA